MLQTLIKKFQNLIESKPVKTFLAHYQSAEMDLSSIAVAYYLMLTVSPLLVIAANLFPYFNIDLTDLLSIMKDTLPAQLYGTVEGMVVTIFSKPAEGLLGVASLTGLWTMTKSLSSLQKAMNKAYNTSENRDFVLSYLIGLLASLLILFLLTFALVFTTFSEAVLQALNQRYHLGKIATAALYLIKPSTMIIVFMGLLLLYAILPNVKTKKLRYSLPGTLFTSIAIFFFNNIFGQYVSQQFNKLGDLRVFGSVVIFVLMFWFIFIARILIIGSVLNATVQELQQGKLEGREGDVTNLVKKHFFKHKK